MENLVNHLKGKTVLVTGHTGFKGGWLSLWLAKWGAKVVGFSLPPPTTPSLFKLLELEKRVDHHEGDINDFETLRALIEKHQPEIVFHLAAQPIVLESYEKPLQTIQTNVMGTVNLLEILRHSRSVRAAVLATSDKCYEKQNQKIEYEESHPMGGIDPYSASKGAVEILIQSYYRSFFAAQTPYSPQKGIGSVRAGNVIGGGDWGAHRLIPDAIRSIAKNQPIQIRNPHFCRPWQHVLEALSGYLSLAARLLTDPQKYSGPWNFSSPPEEALTVGQMISLLIEEMGHPYPVIHQNSDLFEDRYLHLSCKKAAQSLGWKSVWTPKERIRNSWKWYDAYLKNSSSLVDLSLEQIEAFEEGIHESSYSFSTL